jgi:hypothetical protein
LNLASPGVDEPKKEQTIGFELNCEMTSCIFITAVENSLGLNVTLIVASRLKGITPMELNKIKNERR